MADVRITTQSTLRESFWNNAPRYIAQHRGPSSKRQNEYPVDVRMAFVDYVDMLARDGDITDALAHRVTL